MWNGFKKRHEVWIVGLFFSLFLLFQYVLPLDVQYSSRTYFAFYGQLQVFVGIAIGQIVAFFFERIKKVLPKLSFLKLGIWLSLNTALHIVFPEHGWIFAISSFAGFGFFIGSLYASVGIKNVVIGAGVAGIIAAILFLWISQIDTRLLKVSGFTLFFIAHAIHIRRVRFIHVILWLLVLMPFIGDWHQLRPRVFRLSHLNLSFAGAPAFSSMLRTDVVKSEKNVFYLLTNGSRLAVIPTWATKNKEFTDPINEMGPAAEKASALIIGSAGGRNVRALLGTRIGEIVANDINPQVFTVIRERFGKATDFAYDNPRVRTVAMDARRLLQIDQTEYDFIFIETLATATRAGGFSGWVEASMYTAEAFSDMYKRLKPGGRILFSEYKIRSTNQETSDSFANRMFTTLKCNPEFGEADIWIEDLTPHSGKSPIRALILGDEREILHLRKPTHSAEKNRVSDNSKCRNMITDDRPFFLNMQFEKEGIRPVLLFGIATLLICIALIGWLSRVPVREAVAVIGSGAAYTLGISAISGLAAFQLGSPFHVTPFILILSFSMGFVTFGLFRTVVRSLWAPVFMISMAIAASVLLLSGGWTDIQTLALKMAVLFALTSIPMFIFELPFLYFLRISERRPDIVAYENVGAIAGILLAVGLKGLIAYSTLFIVSLAVAILASIYAIHLARRFAN